MQLGDSGVAVSALCLGAMYLGTRNDEESSFRLLDQYLGAGGSFIDTANIYAHWVPGFQGGESESLLGRWMRARRNRADLFLATKVGFDYHEVQRGLTAQQIQEECEKSLVRLGVETIDLYYAHVDDRATPQEETLAAFTRLVESGKVRFVGASNFLAWRLEAARSLSDSHGWPRYCCVQQRYSYLRPRPGASFDPQVAVNEDLLDYCRTRPVSLLAYSVLLSGAFTRPERPVPDEYRGSDTEARLAALREVAAETGATPNQVILAWMLAGDPPVIPLIAASTPEQLAENIAALEVQLTSDQMWRLTEASG